MKRIACIMATAALVTAVAHADGPGAYRPVEKPAGFGAPQLGAIEAYNAGYAAVRRADELKDRDQADAIYREALKKFDEAVKLDPAMHEAYTYIGYAQRNLRDYDAALQAYAQALRINPDYPHAIEYQGEAFVRLGRMEEAKFNYLRLYALSPPLAAKLLASMQEWIAANRDASSVELEAWIAERADLAVKAGNDRPGSGW